MCPIYKIIKFIYVVIYNYYIILLKNKHAIINLSE